MKKDRDQEAVLQASRILRERATAYALAGTLIAVIAVILGTLLVCQQVYDGITLDNITRAHRENVAIWALDTMPFLFGIWGQIASFRMAREAGSLVESGTGQLRQELEQARYTSRAKTDFFARMSHELRTPLNAIIGMSDLLAEANDPERRRHQTKVIRESANSLLTLINDVLDLSRIEAGRMEIDSVEFDLHDHLNSAAILLEPQAMGKGIRLISLIPRDAPRHVVGDPGRLRQVLVNLLGNAIKFTDQGEVVLNLRSWKRLDDGYRLSIEVADTGVGIASQHLGQLFEPYQQAGKNRAGGTGLGLSITRELVHAMDGEIDVDSEPERGSVFAFTMRVGLATSPEEAPDTETIQLRDQRLLLAEADTHAREMLAGQLRATGIQVTAVADGVEAMQQALRAVERGEPYDIVLSDMFLPHLSGEELGRRLKARPQTRDCCIGIMTTAGARGDAKRFNEAGFAAYLTRPIPPEHLQEILRSILATRSLSQAEKQRKGLVTRFSIPSLVSSSDPVMVIDDSPVNREIALEQLGRLGIRAEGMSSGAEAIEALRGGEYAALLLDQHLPDCSGDEFIVRLRSTADKRANLPVIVFTAGMSDEERRRCEQAGASDILVKPVRAAALHAALVPHLEMTTIDAAATDPSTAGEDAADGTVTPALALLFLREADERIEAIRQAVDGEPALEAVAQQAHGLKGACQHVPAAALTRCTERLERAALDDDVSTVRTELQYLAQQWAELRQQLEKFTARG